MNELLKTVALQLKNAKSKEEFDKIFNYHFPTKPEVGKKILSEEYGVDFSRFEKKEPKINLKAVTRMIIDEPLVEEEKEESLNNNA